MKFFDLEMNDALSFGKKGGNRDVSYSLHNSNGDCAAYLYTNGGYWEACMSNKFQDSLHNSQCMATFELRSLPLEK